MKKIMTMLIAIIMLFALVACGQSENETKPNSPNDETSSEQQNKTDSGNYAFSEEDLPGVINIKLENVEYSINSPSVQIYNKGYRFVNMGGYYVIYDQFEDMTSETIYGINKSAIKSSEDILKGMEKQVIAACSYGLVKAENYELIIDEKTNLTKNGWEMTKYQGAINLLFDMENPAVPYTTANYVGYGIIKDDCPVYFLVVDIPTENGEEDIGTIAEKIANSFRNYEG